MVNTHASAQRRIYNTAAVPPKSKLSCREQCLSGARETGTAVCVPCFLLNLQEAHGKAAHPDLLTSGNMPLTHPCVRAQARIVDLSRAQGSAYPMICSTLTRMVGRLSLGPKYRHTRRYWQTMVIDVRRHALCQEPENLRHVRHQYAWCGGGSDGRSVPGSRPRNGQ
ncbi:hypothetical protein L227DRAFT_581417 [Lentinus tigrinus ALCF2SS1-6]|uniref:Uncharacterized protein n=1 Tax=Lentinus tigrinus ALCF2SS1-6 TaxID=1328759 RepID=A0A5C2RP22_9APHY|nr:hypothetical protein L227DRAFT_581417 [Lentinus tigrinus ALCF2SS1-6]